MTSIKVWVVHNRTEMARYMASSVRLEKKNFEVGYSLDNSRCRERMKGHELVCKEAKDVVIRHFSQTPQPHHSVVSVSVFYFGFTLQRRYRPL